VVQSFGEICDSIKVRKDGHIRWAPTLIMEVGEDTPKKVVRELCNLGKNLSCDECQAKCIIVLESPSTRFSMNFGF
jgi:hypothetical protein